ncbi:hypothetical protein AAGS61_12885 [Lysinibacillus sp. KU-BSD001]|uniref:hypothetical protein n=1 Tax=Lysinibacillus sp. KU-BSD001 TaxID=3141328 RepID=UPI0036EC947D
MNRSLCIIMGFFFLIVGGLINWAHISQGKFPESLMIIGIAIMCFCLAYLDSHFKAKDERAQKIRERGIYISYFWLLAIMLILLILVNPYFNIISISAYHLLLIVMTCYISIVFINLAYYAWKL